MSAGRTGRIVFWRQTLEQGNGVGDRRAQGTAASSVDEVSVALNASVSNGFVQVDDSVKEGKAFIHVLVSLLIINRDTIAGQHRKDANDHAAPGSGVLTSRSYTNLYVDLFMTTY